MKKRLGFVSNSSSSCFILDLCDEESQDILNHLLDSNISNLMDTFGRLSGYEYGKDLEEYLLAIEEDGDDYFNNWLRDAINQLGLEFTLLIRVSDEDDVIINIPPHLIYTESEYH